MQVLQTGCKGRPTSVGEAVDVKCTEHNHPQDQASNMVKKLVSSMRKGQYSLCGLPLWLSALTEDTSMITVSSCGIKL